MSKGLFLFSLVPTMVELVTVTDRSVTSVTLEWTAVEGKGWSYNLEIDGEFLPFDSTESRYTVSPLKPGTEYPFSVITTFFGLNSTAYMDFTVTGINRTQGKLKFNFFFKFFVHISQMTIFVCCSFLFYFSH